MIRMMTVACAVLLAPLAVRAQEPPAQPAPAQPAAEAPVAQPAATAPIAADPVALARAALDRARATQCRYAFSQSVQSNAQAGLGSDSVGGLLRFDPRLAIGERWTVVNATKHVRALQRNLARIDKQGPATDLMQLLPEGDITMSELAVEQDLAEVYMFKFKPVPNPERITEENARNMAAQMVGALETRRDGTIVRRTLRVPEGGIRVGIAKLQSGSISRGYVALPDGQTVADSEVYTARATALLSGAEVTTTGRLSDIEPICDAAVVAEIAGREAAARATSTRR